jgi:hypothetical protein
MNAEHREKGKPLNEHHRGSGFSAWKRCELSYTE